MAKVIRIVAVYRKNGKNIKYGVTGAYDGIVAAGAIYSMLKSGYEVRNIYTRQGKFVIKNYEGVAVYHCSEPITVCCERVISEPSAFKFFDARMQPAMFDKTMFQIMKEIDKAKPLSDFTDTGRVQTQQGVCDITSLSSGCKSVLWCYYCEREAIKCKVNLTSAGVNALDILFDVFSAFGNEYAIPCFSAIPVGLRDQLNQYICKNARTGKIEDFIGVLGDLYEEG